jgi:hypothetical protein
MDPPPRLSHNPADAHKYSHIILDEAHERSCDQDFLCLVLKRLLFRGEGRGGSEATGTRLVVMSATLQSSLFSDYFLSTTSTLPPPPEPPDLDDDDDDDDDDASEGDEGMAAATASTNDGGGDDGDEPIFVGAGRFPVEIVYADDIASGCLGVSDARMQKTASQVAEASDREAGARGGRDVSSPASAAVRMPHGTPSLIAALCNHIAAPGRCVLCFLPGVAKIEEVAEAVGLCFAARSGLVVVHVLHGMLEREEQDVALALDPERCKVVLSTNIAESSVTLPDVTHVIDAGLCNYVAYDPQRRAPVMVTARASAASMRQRSGRAGRVAPGTAIRLISRAAAALLAPHDPPEMLTSPLEAIVLKSKVLLSSLGPAEELLRDALEPPSDARVHDALLSLQRLGAITTDAGEVTPLGAFAARIPMLDITRARLLLMACLDGAPCEGVLVAAALSGGQDVFLAPSAVMCKTSAEFYAASMASLRWRRKWDAGRGCDVLATRAALLAWLAGPRSHAWGVGLGLAPRRLNAIASAVRGLARIVPAAAAAAAAAVAAVSSSSGASRARTNKKEGNTPYVLPLKSAQSLAWLEQCAAPGGARIAGAPPAGALASLDLPPAFSASCASSVHELGYDDLDYVLGATPARAASEKVVKPPRRGVRLMGSAGKPPRRGVGLMGTAGACTAATVGLEESERARLTLTLLAVLGCPDNMAVGLTKAWPSKMEKFVAKAGIELSQAAYLKQLPPSVKTPTNIMTLLEAALGPGAISRVVVQSKGRAFIKLATLGEEEREGAGRAADEDPTATFPWTASPVRVTPTQVQDLDAMRGGKFGATVSVPNPWPTPPGATNPAPDELSFDTFDVPNRLMWRLLPPPGSGADGAALSRLSLHPTWRGPMGTLTNSNTAITLQPIRGYDAEVSAAQRDNGNSESEGEGEGEIDNNGLSSVIRAYPSLAQEQPAALPVLTRLSPPPLHFLTSASLITFGNTLAIPTGVTLLPGDCDAARLTVLAARPGHPSGGALVDPRNGNTWAVRLDDGPGGGGDQSIELDMTPSGRPLTLADWEEMDAIRAGLTGLSSGFSAVAPGSFGKGTRSTQGNKVDGANRHGQGVGDAKSSDSLGSMRRFASLVARVRCRLAVPVPVHDADSEAPLTFALVQVRFGDDCPDGGGPVSGGVAAYSPFATAGAIREALARTSLVWSDRHMTNMSTSH